MNDQRVKARLICLGYYGKTCACCGEPFDAFLLVVDADNRGLSGNEYVARARDALPGYVTLCYNCHMAKKLWGACPHSLSSPSTPSFRSRKRELGADGADK